MINNISLNLVTTNLEQGQVLNISNVILRTNKYPYLYVAIEDITITADQNGKEVVRCSTWPFDCSTPEDGFVLQATISSPDFDITRIDFNLQILLREDPNSFDDIDEECQYIFDFSKKDYSDCYYECDDKNDDCYDCDDDYEDYCKDDYEDDYEDDCDDDYEKNCCNNKSNKVFPKIRNEEN
jgi:hypothetical protein